MPTRVEQLDRPRAGVAARHVAVLGEHLHDLVADGEDRVERAHRVLEDHGELTAADPAQLALAHCSQVSTVEQDPAAQHRAGLRHEPDDGPAGHALPRPGLAHEPDDLACADARG